MKILAIPYGEIDGNSCQYMLYREMQNLGCTIQDCRIVSPFKGKYDIIHVHWPELFANGKTLFHVLKKSSRFLLALRNQKRKKAKLVWTCHDVISHYGQYPVIEKWLMKRFIKMVDAITVPLTSSYEYACHYFPELGEKPYTVISTGHYIGIYSNETGQAEARKKLNLPEKAQIIGLIGNISEYKGIYELLDAFDKTEHSDTFLLLAGIPNTVNIKKDVEKAASADQRIKIYWGHIPNAKLQLYLNASDVIVLPFRKINNSGSLYLALSFNKQVLVPDFPQMLEVKKKYAPDYVHTYPKGKLSTTDLAGLLKHVKDHKEDVQPDLSEMNYDVLARKTIDFFTSLVK